MRLHGIDFPEDKIADFCRRHNVKSLALFGSILRDDFRADSDIDFLIELLPGTKLGLFGFAGMHLELEKLLGREVQLHTLSMLGPSYRDRVAREAVVQYAA
jgi:predicted nucleotidyltransferase